MRAVLDTNVLISAIVSPHGVPAELLRGWGEGEFQAVASPALVAEVERVLAYPKVRKRVSREEAAEAVAWIRANAAFVADPEREPPVRSADPGDDYLVALAASERCALVSGDRDLLELSERIPVFSPREFLDLVRSHEP